MTVWGLCKVSLLALGIRSAMAKRNRGHPRYSVKWFGEVGYGMKGITCLLTEEA
jgi:hypothetical protein